MVDYLGIDRTSSPSGLCNIGEQSYLFAVESSAYEVGHAEGRVVGHHFSLKIFGHLHWVAHSDLRERENQNANRRNENHVKPDSDYHKLSTQLRVSASLVCKERTEDSRVQ